MLIQKTNCPLVLITWAVVEDSCIIGHGLSARITRPLQPSTEGPLQPGASPGVLPQHPEHLMKCSTSNSFKLFQPLPTLCYEGLFLNGKFRFVPTVKKLAWFHQVDSSLIKDVILETVSKPKGQFYKLQSFCFPRVSTQLAKIWLKKLFLSLRSW